MKRAAFFLAMTLAVYNPHIALAWGKKGHNLVAEIAWAQLDDKTRNTVQKYLGTTTIEQASTWMDDVRRDHQYDYMKQWHYINIAKGSAYVAAKGDNIVNALNKAITALEHKDKLSSEEIKQNLLVIFHLAGDFHQPLHLGYEEDKGGNTINLEYMGRHGNLHWIWDTEIIESEKITQQDCTALMRTMSKAELQSLKKTDPEGWIPGTRALLPGVYSFKGDTIDEQYIARAKPVIEKQLLIAGIRLSALLEHVMG